MDERKICIYHFRTKNNLQKCGKGHIEECIDPKYRKMAAPSAHLKMKTVENRAQGNLTINLV
jgi:hypothetical protein